MNRSWRIARIAGIDLSLHWTFLALMVWVVLQGIVTGGWTHGARELVMAASLFACIVLHEYGHAFAARFCGIDTLGITLLPIGGVASLERIPRRPRQELFIALAGPAVNVVLLFLLLLALPMVTWSGLASQSFFHQIYFRLLLVNGMLIAFNLLPAFPMDGGRVLRALLATRKDYVSATRLATRAGQFVAILLCVAGAIWNPFLIAIALFVALAGEAEYQHVLAEQMMGPAFAPATAWSPAWSAPEPSAWKRHDPVTPFPLGQATFWRNSAEGTNEWLLMIRVAHGWHIIRNRFPAA